MCLIILTPNIKRARIRKSVLERGFYRNNDGWGIAYIENGLVKIVKGTGFFDDCYLAYQRIRSKIKKGPLLIHFRRTSCGASNQTNTQPLVIYHNKLVMAHNGTFTCLREKAEADDVSDSVTLARMIRRTGWNYPFNKAHTDFLKALCDDTSKLVFLDNKGRYAIVNEQLGKWSRGCWYSDKGEVLEKQSWQYKSTYSYGPYSQKKDNRYDEDDFGFNTPSKKKRPTDGRVIIKQVPSLARNRTNNLTAEQKMLIEDNNARMNHLAKNPNPNSTSMTDPEWQQWLRFQS